MNPGEAALVRASISLTPDSFEALGQLEKQKKVSLVRVRWGGADEQYAARQHQSEPG